MDTFLQGHMCFSRTSFLIKHSRLFLLLKSLFGEVTFLQFLHLCNKINNSPYLLESLGFNALMHVKPSEECLAQRKCLVNIGNY